MEDVGELEEEKEKEEEKENQEKKGKTIKEEKNVGLRKEKKGGEGEKRKIEGEGVRKQMKKKERGSSKDEAEETRMVVEGEKGRMEGKEREEKRRRSVRQMNGAGKPKGPAVITESEMGANDIERGEEKKMRMYGHRTKETSKAGEMGGETRVGKDILLFISLSLSLSLSIYLSHSCQPSWILQDCPRKYSCVPEMFTSSAHATLMCTCQSMFCATVNPREARLV